MENKLNEYVRVEDILCDVYTVQVGKPFPYKEAYKRLISRINHAEKVNIEEVQRDLISKTDLVQQIKSLDHSSPEKLLQNILDLVNNAGEVGQYVIEHAQCDACQGHRFGTNCPSCKYYRGLGYK